jgi:tetratricopeptide (TPR) repeat protein
MAGHALDALDRRLRRAPRAVALALLLCAAATPARAQSPEGARDPAAEERRTALYKEGKALTSAERWGEAIEKFEQVVAIRSAPPALYALALAQERAGRLATAKKTYERAGRDARAANDAKMADEAEGALRVLAPRVPRIQLRLTRQTAGAQVRVDRAVAATAVAGKVEIEVDPGKRLVEVDAPGHEKWSREITLRVSQVEALEVELRASSAEPQRAAADRPPTRDDQGGGGPPAGAVVLGAGGVALGIAGAVLRFTAQSDYDAAREGCNDDGRCADSTITDDGNAARTRIIVGTVLLGAGAAALAGGGLWWALSGTSKSSARVPSVGVGVGVAGSGVETSVRGKF